MEPYPGTKYNAEPQHIRQVRTRLSGCHSQLTAAGLSVQTPPVGNGGCCRGSVKPAAAAADQWTGRCPACLPSDRHRHAVAAALQGCSLWRKATGASCGSPHSRAHGLRAEQNNHKVQLSLLRPTMRLCLQGDIRTFGGKHAVVGARTYLGLTVELFDNKFHKAQLFRCPVFQGVRVVRTTSLALRPAHHGPATAPLPLMLDAAPRSQKGCILPTPGHLSPLRGVRPDSTVGLPLCVAPRPTARPCPVSGQDGTAAGHGIRVRHGVSVRA